MWSSVSTTNSSTFFTPEIPFRRYPRIPRKVEKFRKRRDFSLKFALFDGPRLNPLSISSSGRRLQFRCYHRRKENQAEVSSIGESTKSPSEKNSDICSIEGNGILGSIAIARPFVYAVIYFSLAFLCPIGRTQVPPALGATRVVSEAVRNTKKKDENQSEYDHEFSPYTRSLLETVSELVKQIQEVKNDKCDIGAVKEALNEVKSKKKDLQAEIMNGLYAELRELRGEKVKLVKRLKELLDALEKVMKEGDSLKAKTKGLEEGLQDKVVQWEELRKTSEKEYNEISEKIEEIEDRISYRETMTLSIGVRELAFIERESEQLVEGFMKEMRSRNVHGNGKSPLTKLSRSQIKEELITVQKRLIQQTVLPNVLQSEEPADMLEASPSGFALRIKQALRNSGELQRNLENRVRKKMNRYGDEKWLLVNTPAGEVVKGFPEIELKWMFGSKEIVVPKAVRLHLYHGWKKWREEAKEKLKSDLLDNVELGKKYVAKRQESVMLDRDRVASKTWYNEEKGRWEMEPLAVPYAVSRKLVASARIRHDWGAAYVMMKGDDKDYFVDGKEYEMQFEDFGGFDGLYAQLLAYDIPTSIQLMWIPLSELDISQQFVLVMTLCRQCLSGLWNSKPVTHARDWLINKLRNLNDDIMMVIGFPIVELIIPYWIRIRLGMAWPDGYQTVGSTWYLKWQSEAEKRFKSRKTDEWHWYFWFLIKCGIYGYVLFHVFHFARRKVPRFFGYGPLRRDPNLRKLQRLKYYVKYKLRKIKSKKKEGFDPISTAFDQMKRVKNPPIRLKDFASVESMKEEINEVVAFLRNPRAFQEMGARAPRGVLIVGERGTGKTCLALAIAAEAKVPVVEVKAQQLEPGLWVGQSASNVRELFQTARDLAPVIILVEDFDLFAGVRGKFIHTKEQDHEAFINQLLVELDGFEKQEGVVLMATTRNLKNVDEALRRPGRMDRVFHLQRPTQVEREKILRVAAKETMDDDLINFVDWKKVAEKTALLRPVELKLVPVALEGSAFRSKFLDTDELMTYCSWLATFSGFFPKWIRSTKVVKEISKILINHLGLTLTKEDLQNVVDLMEPYGQISNGIELLNPPVEWTWETKFPHAVWAAGRGLIAYLLPNFDVVENLWLEPYSWEGIGCTKITKARSEGSLSGNVESRAYLEKKLVFCFGSYIASQLLLSFGEENILSSSELKNAQEIATRMVIQYGWGLDDSPTIYHHGNAVTALSMGNTYEYEIAAKVQKIYDSAYMKAREMLQKNKRVLEKIVDELLEYEILTGKDVQRIFMENGGVQEKEPFSLSTAHEEEPIYKGLLENGNASGNSLVPATSKY